MAEKSDGKRNIYSIYKIGRLPVNELTLGTHESNAYCVQSAHTHTFSICHESECVHTICGNVLLLNFFSQFLFNGNMEDEN